MVDATPKTRRAEALLLAEGILADIELSRIVSTEIARKTVRLARLLNDADAMGWLRYEVNGYKLVQPDNLFDTDRWLAALRSNRDSYQTDGRHTASALSLGELEAHIEGAKIQLAAAADPPVSLQSANPSQFLVAPRGDSTKRAAIRNMMASQQAVVDKTRSRSSTASGSRLVLSGSLERRDSGPRDFPVFVKQVSQPAEPGCRQ